MSIKMIKWPTTTRRHPPSSIGHTAFVPHAKTYNTKELDSVFIFSRVHIKLKGLLVFQSFSLTIFHQFTQTAHHMTMQDLHGHDTSLLFFCILNPLNTKRVCFTYIRTWFIPHSKHCTPRLHRNNRLML